MNRLEPVGMPTRPGYAELYEGWSQCYDRLDTGEDCAAEYESLQNSAERLTGILLFCTGGEPGIVEYVDELASLTLKDVLANRRINSFLEPMDFHE